MADDFRDPRKEESEVEKKIRLLQDPFYSEQDDPEAERNDNNRSRDGMEGQEMSDRASRAEQGFSKSAELPGWLNSIKNMVVGKKLSPEEQAEQNELEYRKAYVKQLQQEEAMRKRRGF